MITIKHYDELRRYVVASVEGTLGLLTLQSVGGLGKSYTIKDALRESCKPHVVINGHATPASTYEQLFLHRNETIFIDDVDSLFRNPAMVGILKCLCDTDPVKRVQYNSKSPLVADLPREFTTRSTVIIALNKLPRSDVNLRALLTRGVHALFTPSPEEVVRQIRTFANDGEILALIKSLVRAGGAVDLRKYVVASQLKASRLDWKSYLRQEMEPDSETALCLELHESGWAYKRRAEEWVLRTGKTARSYDRKLKDLSLNGKFINGGTKKRCEARR